MLEINRLYFSVYRSRAYRLVCVQFGTDRWCTDTLQFAIFNLMDRFTLDISEVFQEIPTYYMCHNWCCSSAYLFNKLSMTPLCVLQNATSTHSFICLPVHPRQYEYVHGDLKCICLSLWNKQMVAVAARKIRSYMYVYFCKI